VKALRYAPALVLVFAAPASARSAAWCQVNGSNFQTYLSGIVEIDDGPDAFRALAKGPFAKSFKEYVQASYDPRASKLDCNKQESRFYAEDYIDVLISANPGYKFVKTGWRGSRSTASADPTLGKSSSSAQTLRFKK
jgi:hypothetical protein